MSRAGARLLREGSSLGESRGNLRKVFLQPDHDQDIISAEYEAIVGWHEKRSTKDRDETNRRREGSSQRAFSQ